MHDFLFTQESEPIEFVDRIPTLREEIEALPETCATWKPGTLLDEECPQEYREIHIEFLGAWEAPERYQTSQRGRHYVNPDYAHAEKYTDGIHECPCGAKFARKLIVDGYEETVSDETQHADDCVPWMRHRLRADISRYRHDLLFRLVPIGWYGNEILRRMGTTDRTSLGDLARVNGVTMTELRDRFRKDAGETYAYMVRELGWKAKEVAEIYGVTYDAMHDWATEYTDYEPLSMKEVGERKKKRSERREKRRRSERIHGGN